MKKVETFNDILEAADKLSPDEKEMIIDILHRRMVDNRRKELAAEIRGAQLEYKTGKCRPVTQNELLKEIIA